MVTTSIFYIFCSKKPAAPAGYWEGSPDIPIYEQGCKSGYSAQELAEIIFPDTENKFCCRKHLLCVRSRKTFLIDLQYLSIEDLYADENGAYKHQATRSRTCLVELDEEKEMEDFKITECKKIDLSDSENSYYLVQRHRVCESCNDLKTITSYFECEVLECIIEKSFFLLIFTKGDLNRRKCEFARGVALKAWILTQVTRAFAQWTNAKNTVCFVV